MSIRNHTLGYRPLRGGIAIVNPHNQQGYGTLGCIATANGTDRWIISCYHVLCRFNKAPAVDGEEIFQPYPSATGQAVALTMAARADANLDCAAAKIVMGVISVNEILGIGSISGQALDVQNGMRVLKAGLETGVTEGVVRNILGNQIIIEVPDGFAEKYDLSSVGDSGAIWIEQSTRRPVALHISGNDTGEELAYGVNINVVLHSLGLSLP